MPLSNAWQPKTFLRFEEARDTSMGTARIVTDAGPAFIKALGNRQGPHPLACEWVASQLADWFGLPTFDFGTMTIDASVDEIPFLRGGNVVSGTAFLSRAVQGHPWGGSAEELENLVNPESVSRLIVFDNWTLNCDRHPPDLTTLKPNHDNVFLADGVGDDEGRCRLMAMDHTHCFTCGRDLDAKVANIERVKDDRLYGLFPGFVAHVRQVEVEAAIDRLKELEQPFVRHIVSTIPEDWEVKEDARQHLVELIIRRATHIAETLLTLMAKTCWPNKLFDKRP